MRAAVFADGGLQVQDIPTPVPGPNEMVLRVTGAGICGSDLHALELGLPAGQVLGHEFAGIVDRIGEGVEGFKEGQAVCSIPAIGCGSCGACAAGRRIQCSRGRLTGLRGLHGAYAQYVLVGAYEAIPLPETLDPALGALVEPLSVSLQAVERAHLRIGEPVLVLGAGPIGLAAIIWARIAGAGDIIASDPIARRRELALACGATVACDPRATDPVTAVRQASGKRPPVVIDAAGVTGSFMEAGQAVEMEGRVVIVGLHPGIDEIRPLRLMGRNVHIDFSNWAYDHHFRTTVRMIGLGRLDPTPMVTARIGLDEAPETYLRLRKPSEEGKVLITP
jgi:(R,R)-butanediol dehydrogenase/meso-butanediol dehydrogenase/diacetyl reductase